VTLSKKLRGHDGDKRDFFHLRLRSKGYRLLIVRDGITGSAADPN